MDFETLYTASMLSIPSCIVLHLSLGEILNLLKIRSFAEKVNLYLRALRLITIVQRNPTTNFRRSIYTVNLI